MSQTERFDDTHFITLGSESGESCESSSATRSLKPGDVIGGTYILKSLLGQGGMGYVFRAEHNIIKKDYALKIIRPDKLDNFSLQRFEIEGRVIAKLDHPNIVKIYNMGIDEGNCPYYVMDLLPGQPLSQYINRGDDLTFEQCLDIFHQVALGLEYAHKKGIVHRDIKPGNFIMLESTSGFQAKIVDFGLAKVIPPGGVQVQGITAKGQVFGSPYYMSPEQCQGEAVDQRSDIYSLGCALFESIAGEPPFIGANAVETLMMHTDAPMPKLTDRFSEGLAFAVDSILVKMTAKNPADRYQNMSEVVSAFERLRKRASTLALGHGDNENQDSVNFSESQNSTFTHTSWRERPQAKWLSAVALLLIVSLAALALLFKDRLSPSLKEDALPVEVAALLSFGPIKSHNVGTTGAKVFEFPDYFLGSVIPLETNISKKAMGSVAVAHGDMVAFSVDEADVPVMFQYPQIFEQLGKDDFFGLELKARGSMVTLRDNLTFSKEFNSSGSGRTAIIEYSHKKLLEILKIATGWTRLRALSLDGFNADEPVWTLVEKMPLINMMVLKRMNFDIEEFAKHKFLDHLTYFRLQDPLKSNADPIIRRFIGNANLVELNLDDVEFATPLFAKLKTCPRLERISLSRLELSDQLIKALSEIKTLRAFSSDGTILDDSQLTKFAKMKNVKVTLKAEDYFAEGAKLDMAKFTRYKKRFPTLTWHL